MSLIRSDILSDILLPLVRNEEMFSATAYPDNGQMTIGYGHRCSERDPEKVDEYWAMNQLAKDLVIANIEADEALDHKSLGEIRDCAAVEMMFCLGTPRFLDFKKFCKAWRAGDHLMAAHEMLASEAALGRSGKRRWSRRRVERLHYMLLFNGFVL